MVDDTTPDFDAIARPIANKGGHLQRRRRQRHPRSAQRRLERSRRHHDRFRRRLPQISPTFTRIDFLRTTAGFSAKVLRVASRTED